MMFRKTFLVFLLIAFCGNTNLLAKGIYQLDGYIGISGGESFHYKIELKDSATNLMSGYGYTYSTKDKIVKAYLTAVINRQDSTLHIREQRIIYNHHFTSHATICLVNARLKWNEKEGNLSGTLITATMNNGATCSSGSITFFNPSQINALFNPTVKKQPELLSQPAAAGAQFYHPRSNPNIKLHAYFEHKEQLEAAAKAKLKQTSMSSSSGHEPAKKIVRQITEGKEGVYQWHSGKIIFEIWDGGDVDNDIVTVTYNGKILLKNYSLQKAPKELILPAKKGENIIVVTADNEGGNPPNTANILLKDGKKNYSVLAHNSYGKKAIIRIERVMP